MSYNSMQFTRVWMNFNRDGGDLDMPAIKVYAGEGFYDFLDKRSLNLSTLLGNKVTGLLDTEQCPLKEGDFIFVSMVADTMDGTDILIEINAVYSEDRFVDLEKTASEISEYIVDLHGLHGIVCQTRISLGSHDAYARAVYGSGMS